MTSAIVRDSSGIRIGTSGGIRRLFVHTYGPSEITGNTKTAMVSPTLVSTALMGLLVLATFIAVGRLARKRASLTTEEGDRYERLTASLGSLVRTPAVWTVTFIVVTVGIGVLVILSVGSFGLPEGLPATLLNVVYALVGLLIGGFVFLGAYTATRERGLGNAQGVAAGSAALGMILMLVIALQLVVGIVG